MKIWIPVGLIFIHFCLLVQYLRVSLVEAIMYRQQLKEVTHSYNKLKIENQALVNEIDSIKREMEELQDQFRLDDADEFRQLQAELEIATKNCRIFQFKLRKLEKRNDTLEADKVLLHGMCGAAVREQSNMPFHLFFIALIPL